MPACARRNAFASDAEVDYPWAMLLKLAVAVSLALAFALALPACASKPPRQAESPDALADKGADMSSGEDSSGTLKTNPNEKSGEEKMHEKCCGQCKAAAAGDRSGAKLETIPCTDFTVGLDPFCLEHFRGKKTMASECK
jgi:hypothetical protein